MQGYSFPLLKPSEIVACMADMHISFGAEDLERPSPQKMLCIYESFTDKFMGVTRSNYSNASNNFHLMSALESDIVENADLHMEDIALMGFYRMLAKLLQQVGVPDFSIRDLIKPEPGHVRKILSAIINFAKFREERVSVFEQCTKKSVEVLEKRTYLLEKNNDIAERVNTMRLQRAEQEPAYQRVREKNLALTAELRELKRIQTAMTADIENLKKIKSETIEKMNNTQFLLANCKQDCSRLRGRIVPNPEKLQQALVEMNSSILSEKASLTAREKQYRDLLSKMEAMSTVQNDLVICTKLMEECEFEMKKASTAANKLAGEQENAERKNQELRDVNIKEQQFKRQLANISEKITRLGKQQAGKKDLNDAKMGELSAEYESSLKDRDINQAKIESNQARISELEDKISTLRKKIENEAITFQDSYSKLKTRGERYCADLAKMMSNMK
ncbi:kinetochore-associated Ndc80 complex subunit nuf2 [Physocladia obscura]|uniref:Kinetochore-associated Ndc80 complex subunit nuf2 n=1 Tax=Physocladia obscura TaxID=109957 RepID=A0AAD5XGL5_9FUNG|nr:kinetochore-associated Ndc80 complex subunit nuf2 [Physocladia obscura]